MDGNQTKFRKNAQNRRVISDGTLRISLGEITLCNSISCLGGISSVSLDASGTVTAGHVSAGNIDDMANQINANTDQIAENTAGINTVESDIADVLAELNIIEQNTGASIFDTYNNTVSNTTAAVTVPNLAPGDGPPTVVSTVTTESVPTYKKVNLEVHLHLYREWSNLTSPFGTITLFTDTIHTARFDVYKNGTLLFENVEYTVASPLPSEHGFFNGTAKTPAVSSYDHVLNTFYVSFYQDTTDQAEVEYDVSAYFTYSYVAQPTGGLVVEPIPESVVSNYYTTPSLPTLGPVGVAGPSPPERGELQIDLLGAKSFAATNADIETLTCGDVTSGPIVCASVNRYIGCAYMELSLKNNVDPGDSRRNILDQPNVVFQTQGTSGFLFIEFFTNFYTEETGSGRAVSMVEITDDLGPHDIKNFQTLETYQATDFQSATLFPICGGFSYTAANKTITIGIEVNTNNCVDKIWFDNGNGTPGNFHGRNYLRISEYTSPM